MSNSTPSRQTPEADLNTWNQAFRQSSLYREYLTSIGVNPNGPIHLSEPQAEGFERFLASRGVPLPSGMKIDPAGNLNQVNRLGRNVAIGAGIAGATLGTMGLAGAGPLAGVFGTGGGASGAAAAGGVLPSSSIPAASLMGGPAAASANLAAGTGAAGAFGGAAAAGGAGLGATTAPAFGGAASGLQKFFSDPGNIAKVAGVAVPLFAGMGGGGGVDGDSPFNANSPLMQGVQEDMAMSRKRQQQAQPIYDALINMAYGRTPTQYRGVAPAGYGGDQAPAGAYAFNAPRFS